MEARNRNVFEDSAYPFRILHTLFRAIRAIVQRYFRFVSRNSCQLFEQSRRIYLVELDTITVNEFSNAPTGLTNFKLLFHVIV